jgi:hypothetical protein
MIRSISLATVLVDAGTFLMPQHRKAWSIAMTSEFGALSDPNERLTFAIGYLKTSFTAFATTAMGASILGRIMMGAGFVMLAFWCGHMAMAMNVANQAMMPIFLGLSGLYFAIGLSPAHSSVLTQRLSILGVCLALASLLGMGLDLISVPSGADSLVRALSIEVLVILIASSILATILGVLEANATDNDFIA